MPEDFRPQNGWVYGGLEGLADCGPYFGRDHDIRWCEFSRIAPGSAAVFPVKLMVPGRGEGQFKFEEVLKWRYERSILEALYELERAKDGTGFTARSALPPGVDADWLARELA
jgi:hypothetical protein